MRRAIATMLFLFIIALGSCGKKASTEYPVVKREGEPDVFYVAEDNARMKAAIDKARATVSTFIQALRAPKPGQTDFAVKKLFSDGQSVEHMWLTPVTYDGKIFHGTVNNEPDKITGVKLGDKATVEASMISDWMYVDNGKLVGGYTIRVLRDKMSPKEREQADKDLPFVID